MSYPLVWFKMLVEISITDDPDFRNLLCSPVPRCRSGYKVWCINNSYFVLEHALYLCAGCVLVYWMYSRQNCSSVSQPMGWQRSVLYQMKVFLKGTKFAPSKWSNPTAQDVCLLTSVHWCHRWNWSSPAGRFISAFLKRFIPTAAFIPPGIAHIFTKTVIAALCISQAEKKYSFLHAG